MKSRIEQIRINKDFVTIIIAILIVTAIFCYEISLTGGDTKAIIKAVSDGFFVSGALMTGLGILTIIANEGYFNGMTYLGKMVAEKIRYRSMPGRSISYYEYLQEKSGEKKSVGNLMAVGIFCLSIATMFVLMHEMWYD